MAKVRRASKKSTNSNYLKAKISKFLISSQGFPLVITFLMIGLLFVFFRMKSIEQEYAFNNIRNVYSKTSNENKELKAKKAKLLSLRNLRKIANKNKLKEPDQGQIILIP